MTTETKSTCRIFISRKTSDEEVSSKIQRELKKCTGNLEFFDAANLKPGDKWRQQLKNELKKADMFLLLLTRPARYDFDWPLYEAGLFESLNERNRKIICIYADPGDSCTAADKKKIGIPSQFGDTQAVKATEKGVLDLLTTLFTDKTFTNTTEPLQKSYAEDQKLATEVLGPIAATIADAINRVEGGQIRSWTYTNYFIQLHVAAGTKSLEGDVTVESDKGTFSQLFHLQARPPDGRKLWTWKEIAEKIPHERDPAGFNRLWAEQLDKALRAMRSGDRIQQITSRFFACNGKLYRPEIEVYRLYENCRLTIDITFSEQVHDAWLREPEPGVALAANLSLASRIRHELIEPCLIRLDESSSKSTIMRECTRLARLVERIERDGYFIKWLTEDKLARAFNRTEAKKLRQLDSEYKNEIRPLLGQAHLDQEVDITKLLTALELWEQNNLAFLDIGLRCYLRMLGLSDSPPRGAKEVRPEAA